MKNKPLLITLAFLFMLTAACTAAETPQATEEAQPTQAGEQTDSGYPAQDEIDSAYPAQLSAEFEANLTPVAPAPEFSSDTGALTVSLRYPDGERPVRGQLFFAAGTIPVEGVDGGFIPVHDQLNDPSGHSDAQGKLVISNIQPGRYALVLFTPLGAVMVENPDTNDAILFEITAGELTDLGEQIVFLNPDTLEP